ncbi:Arginine deiminase, partial [Bienertia sinuspersici]
VNMHNIRGTLFLLRRSKSLHTLSNETTSESLKRKVANFEKKRKTRNPKKTELFVEVPESRSFLDTATMPTMVTAFGVALFAKLLMMYDESRSQELIERKVKNAPPGQGTVRMLTREEWEEIREVRPRTPFESKLARPNARIKTGGAVKKEG